MNYIFNASAFSTVCRIHFWQKPAAFLYQTTTNLTKPFEVLVQGKQLIFRGIGIKKIQQIILHPLF